MTNEFIVFSFLVCTLQVIQQLAQSVPPALASEEKFTFQGIIKEMCTMLSRCMHCGVRLMATLVVSGLLLKVPSEPALQPLVGNLLSLCVELLSKAPNVAFSLCFTSHIF